MEALRASLYDTLGNTAGRTPFAPAGSDKAAATYLTHCYEELMKSSDEEGSSSASPQHQQSSQQQQEQQQSRKTSPPPVTVTAETLGRILNYGAIDEPLTYVFIFTNPRSGNQQGRSLMNMALHSFRLRDRPEVQVQIYDITDKESLKDGLHYIHQLQLRQGDRLLKTAFPELFEEHRGIRPSPAMCKMRGGGSNAGGSAKTGYLNEISTPAETASQSSSSAWDEWIGDAATQLQNELCQFSDEEVTRRLEQAQESAIKLHVWSAGGDGTVSSTLEALMGYGIDVGRLYFSSIPFGTGNDFADALGWGRSVPGDGVGESMRLLNKTIAERLDGYTCKLDIYEVTITTYEGGHIKHVEKNMGDKQGMRRYTCLMIDYFSLGVQGFVGSSFEMHRPGSRSLNILMYTAASAKWVFMKKFPPINETLESISTVPDAMMADAKLTDADRARWLETASEADRKQVLLARVAGPRKRSGGRKMTWAKEPKARRTATARDFGEGVDENLPVIQDKPIEIDIQNVARFWGRNIDVWDGAHAESSTLSSVNGVTDPSTWSPQYAGDGKLELFGVRNISDYALNQLPARKSYRISRLAQMGSPVALHFRSPENYPPRSSNPLSSRKSIEQGLLYAMCDGEFIEMFRPQDIIVSRKVTLKAIGKSPETSRIVLDTIKNDGLDAVQMDATAAANKTKGGHRADVSNYVASPFQRIFGSSSRRLGTFSSADRHQNVGPSLHPSFAANSGSVLDVKSNPGAAIADMTTPTGSNTNGDAASSSVRSRSSSAYRSPFRSIRNSILRTIRSSSSNIATSHSDGDLADDNTANNDAPSSSSSNIVEDKVAGPSRSHTMTSAAVHHESPLRVRQSLSDMRLSSQSPQNDENNAEVPLVKVTNGNTAVESSSDEGESATESSMANGSHVTKSDSAMSSSSNIPTRKTSDKKSRTNDVSDIGKDLVEFVERTISPEDLETPSSKNITRAT
ncbi:hypothetical protein IWW36_000776 [Coemansia brasiliensis]|uniref:DAGKc domain-containing protein n=1 Tax=Coemansia brasiliensis TaxID=2650707 RepID=A0A9W8IF53_9FUNG|nr:hypothetical protein IWW36_000776 [Coemansia brasiliensis]